MCKYVPTGGGSKNQRRNGKYGIKYETEGYFLRYLSYVVGDVTKLSI
jgi:hypothetical protein